MLEDAIKNLKDMLEQYHAAEESHKPSWRYKVTFSRGMLVGILNASMCYSKISWEQYAAVKKLLEETL